MSKLPFAFILICIFCSWGYTQEHSFSLEDCIDYALENSPAIETAGMDVGIAQAQVNEILAMGLPQLTGQITGQWNYQLQTFLLPSFTNPGETEEVSLILPLNISAGATLNQLVFDGTFFIGLKAARTFVDVARQNKRLSAEDLAVQISKAYYSTQITQANLRLIDLNKDRIKKLLDDTRALYDEGYVEKIDVERLQINHNNLEIERSNLERMTKVTLDLLKFQMGMPVGEGLVLQKEDAPIDPPRVGLLGEAFDFGRRSEYKIMETRQELENFNRRRFHAGYWPSVYFFGNYSWNFQDGKNNGENKNQFDYTAGALGLQINVPIFDGLRKRNQIAQSSLNLEKLETQKSQLENSIMLEIRDSHSRLQNAYDKLASLKSNRDLAEKVFKIAETKFKEGVGSTLEVSDADSQYKQAQVNYLNGLLEYFLARIDYRKAVGDFSINN